MAMATGSEVAISAADLVLTRDDLSAVPLAIGLARRTLRVIRGNLGWALGYNLAALPLAASGLLSPLISCLAMVASSLFVLANSLRLRRYARPTTDQQPVLPVCPDARSVLPPHRHQRGRRRQNRRGGAPPGA
jgi:cation transport ATPase